MAGIDHCTAGADPRREGASTTQSVGRVLEAFLLRRTHTGQHGEPESGIKASFSRESAVESYGSAYSNPHGRDGVRGPRTTRGAGGKSKVSKSIIATDDPAMLLESQRNVLLTASVHRNTRGTYASAVKPWFRWRLSGRLSVYMHDSDSLRKK